MDMQRLLTSLSTRILVQFVVVIAGAAVLLGINYDVIRPFYFENQLTNTGIVINSAILLLLLIGLGNIFWHLLRYRREEQAIAAFIANVEAFAAEPTDGLPANSMVARRHWAMHSIQQSNGEINHAALSAMLNADEATRFGLIRFINNILILTGVFGTIVSLSIALLGASDLIDSADASLGGMGLVIHGMSTALSTTITAIVAYVIFGYFYTRLNDVQTHCLSGIEQLTSIYLLPRYAATEEAVVNHMADLIKSIIVTTERLQQTQESLQQTHHNLQQIQQTYASSAQELRQSIAENRDQIASLGVEFDDIKKILREGFRLPGAAGGAGP